MRIRSLAFAALVLTACSGDEPLSITTVSLSAAREGDAYSARLEAFGGTGAYAWSIADGALPPGVMLAADGAISGTPRMQGSFTFTARVQDEDDTSASKPLTIEVAAGDGILIPAFDPPRGRVGETYLATIDTERSVGTVNWVLEAGGLPAGISLAATGASTRLAGVPEIAGSYDFTLRATDERGSTATVSGTLEIDPAVAPLAILTTRVGTATVGVGYNAQVTADGGSGVGYSWTIASGELPAGLALRTEGTPSTRIAGIPTAPGTATFTVAVRDSEGNTAERVLTIEVVEIELELTPGALPAAQLGLTFTATLSAVGGSGTGHQWNLSGDLPGGLTFTPRGDTAVIAGAPDALGAFPFTIVVADDEGGTASVSYRIDVYPPLLIETAALSNAYVGTATSTPLVASGGSGAGYTWAVVSGTAPPGMSVTTGAFAGTPTMAGTYTFTVAVTDDVGLVSTADYTIEVYDTLRIAPLVLPTATVAVPYDEVIQATGGAPGPRTWTLVGGEVPLGLQLDLAATGDLPIFGTASLFGTYSMQLEVTDPYRGRATATVEIFVYQPLAIATTSLPAAVTGVPYSASILAQGGSTRGYVWTITNGALPAGLSIQTNATPTTTITGISNTPVNASFTVTVTDDRGESVSRPFTLAVVPPIQITTSQIPSRSICTAGYTPIVSTGGVGSGHVWTVTSGSLPTGWALRDADAAVASVRGRGTASGAYAFTLTVTDGGGLTASQGFAVTVTDDPNAQRRAVFVADVEADEQYGLYFTDVCGAPTTPVAVSPTGVVNGDVSQINDLVQLSPNGRFAAFVGDFTTDDVDDLYVVDLDATVPTAINLSNLSATADVTDLFWSPASNRIVYIADAFFDGKEELFYVNLTNPMSPGAPVPISPAMATPDNDVVANSVVWSPDGLRLAFRADATANDVFGLYAVNTTNPALPSLPVRLHPALDPDEDCEAAFAWSPDSLGVLFGCDFDGANVNELFYTNVAAPTPTAVRVNNAGYGANEDVGLGDYRFAPAGGVRLFYLADENINGTEELYVVSMSGGLPSPPVRVLAPLSSGRSISHARWNPQGTRIAFSADLDVNGRDDLYVVDVSGGLPATPARITGNMQASGDVDPVDQDGFSFEWSPDGTKLVFVADYDVDGVDMAYVVDMTLPTYAVSPISPPLADPDLDVATFFWSPDSARVALRQELNTNAQFELLVTNVSGAAPYTAQLAYAVLPGGADVEVPFEDRVFRRDGLAVFFEAPLIIGLDEIWTTDFSAPQVDTATRLSPILDTDRDIALMRIER